MRHHASQPKSSDERSSYLRSPARRPAVALLLASALGLSAWLALNLLTTSGVTLPGAQLLSDVFTRLRSGSITGMALYHDAGVTSDGLPAVATPLACTSSGSSSLGANLVIPPTEVICGDVLVIGGDLYAQGVVRGSIQVISGNVDISGVVTGNVTAIGGNITLQSDANVSGAAHSIGGTVRVAPSATISNTGSDWQEPSDMARAPGLNLTVDAGSFWLGLLFWLSASLGLSVIAPEMIGRVRYTIAHHVALSGITGAFLGFAALVTSVLLVFTCLGIPLALIIAVAAWVAWVVGTVGLSAWIGSVVFGGPRRAPSLILSATLGSLALSLLKALPVAGPVIGVVAGVIALGGATLTLLSARKYSYARSR